MGVSRDSVESHKKFRAALNLPFPLLSDPEAKVHAAYGAVKGPPEEEGKAPAAERTTVVIDETGLIRKVYEHVKVDGHVDAVLRDLG